VAPSAIKMPRSFGNSLSGTPESARAPTAKGSERSLGRTRACERREKVPTLRRIIYVQAGGRMLVRERESESSDLGGIASPRCRLPL